MSEESYYFEDEELYVLLAGFGKSKWYGFGNHRNEKQTWTINDIFTVLAKLYQKNVVTWENGKVVVIEPFNSIMQILSNSAVCITVKKEESITPALDCYFHRGCAVIIERSQRQEKMLKVMYLFSQDICCYLQEEKYIPVALPEESSINMENRTSYEKVKGIIYSIFEKRCVDNGILMEKLIVKEAGSETFFELQKEGRIRYFPACLKKWQDILEEWIKLGATV